MRERITVCRLGLSGRVVTAVTRLFPRAFRTRFGEEMVTTFLDRRDAVLDDHNVSLPTSIARVLVLTLSTSTNFARSAMAERWQITRGRASRRSPTSIRKEPMIKSLFRDTRQALRTLSKQPGYVAVAVLTLALGIGANTAVFSVLNSVILSPLPYPESDRLVRIYNSWEGSPDFSRNFLSGFDFPRFRDGVAGFETAAVMYTYRETGRDLTGDEHSQRVKALRISSDYFETYRATPLFGRTFTREEERNDAGLVILSHRLWRSYTNGDPDILGKTIALDGEVHTVIGVMRPSFLDVIGGDVDLWVPQDLQPAGSNTRGNHYLTGIARLGPGVTIEQAQAQIDAVQNQLAKEFPGSYDKQNVDLYPLYEDVVGATSTTLYILWGAAGLVLLIACVNVANLSLARSVARTKEMAIRTALGSGRGRAAQVSLALVLLIGAGLLIKSFLALRQLNLGFEPDNVATFEVHLPTARYPTGEDRIQFHLALHDRLRALPRVEAVGAASWLPASGMYHSWGYGYNDDAGERQWVPAQVRTVEGDYFEALGIDLIRGRTFAATDQLDADPVAIINEMLATRVYGEKSPLGEVFTFGSSGFTVVGVVSDVAHETRGEFGPRVYLTHSQYGT
ncbi:MAG: ABC transporter permease, partial [Gemmatimonadales bacterium]